MHPSLVVLFLALMLGIQPVTTDLYLPALPAITEGFGASMVQAQLTFTALLLAFGISQLVWGPISDKYGRRPVLLAGLVAYVAASLGSVLSSSMDLLITWRAAQGVAMGAVVMCMRQRATGWPAERLVGLARCTGGADGVWTDGADPGSAAF
jgi:MFS transporter, DHA1 family, multidrug resistance protein